MYTHDNGIRVRIVYDAHRAPLLLYDGDEGPGVGRWMGGGVAESHVRGARSAARLYRRRPPRTNKQRSRAPRAGVCVLNAAADMTPVAPRLIGTV